MSDPPPRQFPYPLPDGALDEIDSLPRLPLTLHYREQRVDAIGLVDSGATVNVLPYRLGKALGAIWSAQQATLRLAGNLGHMPAQPLVVSASIADFDPVQRPTAQARYPLLAQYLWVAAHRGVGRQDHRWG